jgi:hypothetical protein
MKHILYFMQLDDAEKAGNILYEKFKRSVVVYTDRVVFCTAEWLDNMTQATILRRVRSYRPIFNVREGEL